MLKVGIQSAAWYDRENPDASFAFIKECGFEAVDFNIDHYLPVPKLAKSEEAPTSFFDKSLEEILEFFTPLKNAAEKHGVAFSQMHAPFPIWYKDKDALNEHVMMALEKCIEVCAFVGCPAIVVHPVARTTKENEIAKNLELYRRLIPVAKKTGVKVCLENLFVKFNAHMVESACADVSEACYYIDTLNAEAGEECFGFCFDIGHANLMGRKVKRYIKALGNRLTCLHLHDNNGIYDLHGLPYTQVCMGTGELLSDWEGMIEGLREIGYQGVLSFETFRVMRHFPRDLWPELLRLIAATGHYWARRIDAEE